jgi:hypothetical protein
MGLSKEQILDVLKQHGVEFQAFDHAAVMTCEAQARALIEGHVLVKLSKHH